MAITRLVVNIAYTDGRVVRYPLTPKLQMTFERDFHIGISKLDDGPEGVTNVYKLAWHVQRHHVADYPGALPLLDEWLDAVDGIEVETENVVPFGNTASNAGSPDSASLQELAPTSS